MENTCDDINAQDDLEKRLINNGIDREKSSVVVARCVEEINFHNITKNHSQATYIHKLFIAPNVMMWATLLITLCEVNSYYCRLAARILNISCATNLFNTMNSSLRPSRTFLETLDVSECAALFVCSPPPTARMIAYLTQHRSDAVYASLNAYYVSDEHDKYHSLVILLTYQLASSHVSRMTTLRNFVQLNRISETILFYLRAEDYQEAFLLLHKTHRNINTIISYLKRWPYELMCYSLELCTNTRSRKRRHIFVKKFLNIIFEGDRIPLFSDICKVLCMSARLGQRELFHALWFILFEYHTTLTLTPMASFLSTLLHDTLKGGDTRIIATVLTSEYIKYDSLLSYDYLLLTLQSRHPETNLKALLYAFTHTSNNTTIKTHAQTALYTVASLLSRGKYKRIERIISYI